MTAVPRDASGKAKRNVSDNEVQAQLDKDTTKSLNFFAFQAQKGIWRPDAFVKKSAKPRQDFFSRFKSISLQTLGLQLSDDTVAKVNGRIARSFEDAVKDLGGSLYRLQKEFEEAQERKTNRNQEAAG